MTADTYRRRGAEHTPTICSSESPVGGHGGEPAAAAAAGGVVAQTSRP